jgi:hypothetical protein
MDHVSFSNPISSSITTAAERIQSIGIVAIACALAYVWLFVHYIYPSPYHFYHDPEMAYMIDSLGVFKGERYDFCQHPGTPVALVGSFVFALTYPFLGTKNEFLLYHLKNPELFMSIARGLLMIAHIVTGILLIKHAVQVKRWVDALFAIAVAASFYALSPYLGFRSVILWDHNSFNLPFGSLLLLALLVTLFSEPIRRWRVVAIGFGVGVLTATQVYFATWVIGLLVTVTTLSLIQRHRLRQIILSCCYTGVASLLGFVTATVPFTNSACQNEFSTWVHRIIFHQGLYGSGEPGIISTAQIQANLLRMWADNSPLCIAIVLVLAMIGVALFSQRSDHDSRPAAKALVIGLTVQLIVTTAVILKHYSATYLLALAAILPLLLALIHRLIGSSQSKLKALYLTVSLVILTAFLFNLKRWQDVYLGMAQTTQSNSERFENFFAEYASVIGKPRDSLRIVWNWSGAIYSPCLARWTYSSYSKGTLSEEVSRICPNDFYLSGPYVYLSRKKSVLPDDFDWDIIVTSDESVTQWPYLADYGHVSVDGSFIFIANWKHFRSLSSKLVERDHDGYSIFQIGQRFFFGIPRSEPELNLERLQKGEYRTILEGESLNEVQNRISAMTAPSEEVPEPSLIAEWYRGYSIIRSKERFYGAERTEAGFDPNRFATGDSGKQFEGASLDEIKRQIDSFIGPEVVVHGFRGYNIIRVRRDFHGVKQDDGEFSLRRLHMSNYQGHVNALSTDEVKRLVDQVATAPVSDKAPAPVLVEEGYKGFNLVRYGEKIYAIPQREGAFQMERVLKNKYSRWFSGESLAEVKHNVDESVDKD